MGRLVMFLGILLMIIGTIGVIFGIIGVPLQFTSSMLQSVTPTAEELCNPGEELDEVRGAEQYIAGQGYSRVTSYFCVNDAGVRREVTGSFVTGMIGDVINSLGGLLIPLLASCLCTIGIFFTLIGFLVSRRSMIRMATTPGNFVFPDEQIIVTTVQPPSQSSRSQPTYPPATSGALADKLRQLEAARSSGLISEEEYQRLRQEALNELS